MMRSYIEDSTSTEEPVCLAPLAPGERSVSPEKAKLLSKIQSIPEPIANEPGLIFSLNVALYSEIQCPKNAHKDETEAQKETNPAKIYKLHTINNYTIDKTYVFDSSRTAIFPTEVHQGIFTLINIHQSLSFIRSNSCSFQRHFSSAKFDEVL